MTKRYSTSLFIFRRDLRIADNTGLHNALELSEHVIPCFIFTDEQIGPDNTFRSMHAIQFMVESLKDLAHEFEKKRAHLFLFHGTPHTIVEGLIRTEKINAVFVNRDYTPYSKVRDELIEKICNKNNVAFITSPDSLLIEPENGLSAQGTPYQKFTPFFNKNRLLPIAQPMYNHHAHYVTRLTSPFVPHAFLDSLVPSGTALYTHGGRTDAQQIIMHLKDFKNYEITHDVLSLHTTKLSAHNKFGTISIRELYHAVVRAVGRSSGLLRQLYWHDFFTHVAYFNPKVFGHAFQKKFEQVPWSTNKKDFERWCTGSTGFPVVDAGMRQLNATGYMHNRARLIVGSFLTKDLHISWQWGEKYFAQQLADYDPCVNNGNWQWVASTGCDAQPFFRIFNPWLQQKKFDPECTYIKRWIPELIHCDPKIIHTWYNQKNTINGYPLPMVDHATESTRTKELYREAAAKFRE